MDILIDLETTHHGGPDKDSPEAHWRDNYVVMAGWKWVDLTSTFPYDGAIHTGTLDELINVIKKVTPKNIIAHNAKFDIKYILREMPELDCGVLCTQTMLYKLTGHSIRMASLEQTAIALGVPGSKTFDLAGYIKNGNSILDLPKEDLETYLLGDLSLLKDVYQAILMHPNYHEDLTTDEILMLAHMELNGLPIDVDAMAKLEHKCNCSISDAESNLLLEFADRCEVLDTTLATTESLLPNYAVNVTAPRSLSFLLTGYPMNRIKFGKNKELQFKILKRPIFSSALINTIWGKTKPNATTGYSTSEEYLSRARILYPTKPVLVDILTYREAKKILSTYIEPFKAQIAAHKDGRTTVHPKYNTCVTATGRLSSSNPNGQNLPAQVRALVKLQYKDGYIAELDFSQLELHAVAAKSKDPVLISDLNNGEDVHYNVGRSVFNWNDPSDMTKEDRRTVKGVVFGLLYGGGAATISHETGVDKKIINKLIDAFYSRYKQVGRWQVDYYTKVVDGMFPEGIVGGEQIYSSFVIDQDTKRVYKYTEKESPAWLCKKTGRKFSFKPTETKNYPIQGFAGGDIVMSALLHLMTHYSISGWASTVDYMATVHDSIVLNTRVPRSAIKQVAQAIANELKLEYNLPTDLTINVEMGPTWR